VATIYNVFQFATRPRSSPLPVRAEESADGDRLRLTAEILKEAFTVI
jgi:hypothetical protein